ncbi:MAG: hypothetical protein ACJ8NS_06475 [Chthoniobacterales bacterium]
MTTSLMGAIGYSIKPNHPQCGCVPLMLLILILLVIFRAGDDGP